MRLRILRAGVAVLLAASGALMYAASWQRWAGACRWGEDEGALCTVRQGHLYDFLPPIAPWEPVGDAAQLAGGSLLVLALAFLLLPWALTGRRPGPFSAVAQVGAVAATTAVGVATLRSGVTGRLVEPFASDLALYLWLLVAPVLVVRWTIAARGWAMAAGVFLVLATPFVAAISYALGSFDARPWWEAVSGVLTVIGGLCLLADAALAGPFRTGAAATTGAKSPSTTMI